MLGVIVSVLLWKELSLNKLAFTKKSRLLLFILNNNIGSTVHQIQLFINRSFFSKSTKSTVLFKDISCLELLASLSRASSRGSTYQFVRHPDIDYDLIYSKKNLASRRLGQNHDEKLTTNQFDLVRVCYSGHFELLLNKIYFLARVAFLA